MKVLALGLTAPFLAETTAEHDSEFFDAVLLGRAILSLSPRNLPNQTNKTIQAPTSKTRQTVILVEVWLDMAMGNGP